MLDESVYTKWPYIIWKVKNFLNFSQDAGQNIILKKLSFDVVLTKDSGCGKHCSFKIVIMDTKQITEDEKSTILVDIITTTYILGVKQEPRFTYCKQTRLTDFSKYIEIWDIDNDVLQKSYDDLEQSSGEVCVVCIFKPSSCPRKIVRPRLEFELEYDYYSILATCSEWKSFEVLSRDFENFFTNSKGDFLLKSGNHQNLVHKQILRARCKNLWRKIPKYDTKSSEFEVMELDPETLQVFVKYIYCGRIPTITVAEAVKLFTFGMKHVMLDLVDMCVKVMINLANEENVLDLLQLAHKYNHEMMKSEIIHCIISEKFHKSKKWLSFSEENATLALEVYHANVLKNSR